MSQNGTRPEDGWSASAAAWMASVGNDSSRALLDPIMLSLIGSGSVLDVGCGEGRFCRMLRKEGKEAVGLDPTRELLAEAVRQDPLGRYVLGVGERLPFRDDSFDAVVSYLSLIDIPDFRTAILEMTRVVRPGGSLVVANLTSYATAYPHGWTRDESGQKIYRKIDNYLEERADWVQWKGIRIVNWHRPHAAYMQAFLKAGLILRDFLEPEPTAEMIEQNPKDWGDYHRAPYLEVMVWEKPQ
jgi:ubiquinone/menaquinone biosynthesis C-methylase UbiE